MGKGRIGSLVKFEAFVQFVDLALVQNLWEPTARMFADTKVEAVPKSRSGRRRQQQTPTPPKISPEAELSLHLLRGFPNLFHMTFLTSESIRLWAAVQSENLTMNSADLTMKFGAVLHNRYRVIGFVDANTGEQPKPLAMSPAIDGIVTAMTSFREFLGRPADHFGLTPIAIYTPIHGYAEIEAEDALTESPGDLNS